MASIQGILKNDSKSILNRVTKDYKAQMIHYTNLKNSKKQFYTMAPEVISDLADNIALAGGIQEPVVTRKIDVDQYEILGGHKRVAAIRLLVEERVRKDLAFVPVHVVQANDWMAEYLLISLNDYPEKSEYERMTEVIRLQDILPHIEGGKNVMSRLLRKRIAEETGISETRVANYKSIYDNLCNEGMELFRDGALGISAAVELAGVDPSQQSNLIRQGITSMSAIKKYKQSTKRNSTSGEKLEESNSCVPEGTPDEQDVAPLEFLTEEKTATPVAEADIDPLMIAYELLRRAERRMNASSGQSRIRAKIEMEALDMWIRDKEDTKKIEIV